MKRRPIKQGDKVRVKRSKMEGFVIYVGKNNPVITTEDTWGADEQGCLSIEGDTVAEVDNFDE